jgi:hyperosmotically inducible protein
MAMDKGTTETDRTLNNQIRTALKADTLLSDASQKVSLSSDNGVVTLNGTVATEKDKKDLESRVKSMAGVKEVENNLQIGPQTSSSSSSGLSPSSSTTTR